MPSLPMQAEAALLIHAPVRELFVILADDRRYSEWMPSVVAISAGSEGAGRALGMLGARFQLPEGQRAAPAVLHWGPGHLHERDVNLDGAIGTLLEQCIELVPDRRIAWAVVADNLGFSRSLEGLTFSFELVPAGDSHTLVIHRTLYRPRSLRARLLNVLGLRTLFRKAAHRVLLAIQTVAERPRPLRNAPPPDWPGRNLVES